MKFSATISLLVVASLGGFPLRGEQGRAIVSVLAPLAYGPHCWSNIELQNLGSRDVTANVEGHKGNGALVALAGSPSVSLTVAPLQKVTLRLEVPGEESPQGWARISESAAAQGPTLAVSGQTECLDNDRLTTVSQTVAFPTRDPWLTADVKDLPGRIVMILNTANEAATARACYSSGITASRPAENGAAAEPIPVCGKALLVQIPPFGITTLPVEHEGNSEFSVETRGESVVLRVLLPQSGGMKTYTVDSAVTFDDPAGGSTR